MKKLKTEKRRKGEREKGEKEKRNTEDGRRDTEERNLIYNLISVTKLPQ